METVTWSARWAELTAPSGLAYTHRHKYNYTLISLGWFIYPSTQLLKVRSDELSIFLAPASETFSSVLVVHLLYSTTFNEIDMIDNAFTCFSLFVCFKFFYSFECITV